MMKCHYCSDGVMQEFVGYTYKEKKLDDVKGWKCDSCGELTFEAKTFERFEQIDRAYSHLLLPSEIKKIRKSLKLTQEEVAAELKIPRLTLLRWEKGQAIQTPQNDANLRAVFEAHKKRQNEKVRTIFYLDGIISGDKQHDNYSLAAHHKGGFDKSVSTKIQEILKSKSNEKH
jgi:putative zinc finger/helix-turn-helix YgiT family protein